MNKTLVPLGHDSNCQNSKLYKTC